MKEKQNTSCFAPFEKNQLHKTWCSWCVRRKNKEDVSKYFFFRQQIFEFKFKSTKEWGSETNLEWENEGKLMNDNGNGEDSFPDSDLEWSYSARFLHSVQSSHKLPWEGLYYFPHSWLLLVSISTAHETSTYCWNLYEYKVIWSWTNQEAIIEILMWIRLCFDSILVGITWKKGNYAEREKLCNVRSRI